MGDRKVTDTIFGRSSKFEVVRAEPLLFGEPKYYVQRDGEVMRGTFTERRLALETALADAKYG